MTNIHLLMLMPGNDSFLSFFFCQAFPSCKFTFDRRPEEEDHQCFTPQLPTSHEN